MTFSVSDGSLTSNTAERTIDIGAVNDAPANTLPSSYSATEDTSLSLTGLAIDDADIGSGVMTVTLNVPTGTITASSSGGVIVGGSGTGTLTLSGTKADLNAYLASSARPTYVPLADHNGAVTLTMTTSDGATSSASTATINISAVADASDSAPTINEDTPLSFDVLAGFENPGAEVSEINGTPIAVGGTVAISGGTVLYDTDKVLYFTPTADFNGATPFTVKISSGGVTETITMSLALSSVNDAPVASAIEASPLAYAENQGPTAVSSAITLADVDSTHLTGATVEITGNFASGEDRLAFTDQNGITGSWNAATGRLTLHGFRHRRPVSGSPPLHHL